MANIKSAKKRIRTSEKKALRNKTIKSAVKTYIRNVEKAVEGKDKEAADKALAIAVPAIEKASNKGLYHKNNAARKVSRLTRMVNALS